MNALDVRPIAPSVLRRLRRLDDAGHPPVLSVDETGGAPLRCCLAPAQPGDRIALLSYAPLRRWAAETGAEPGPYDEQGPVFIHADECQGPVGGWPDAMHAGHQVARAYDLRGHIVDGVLAEDGAAEAVVQELLTDPEVAVVHLRTLGFGCFLYEVRRKAVTNAAAMP